MKKIEINFYEFSEKQSYRIHIRTLQLGSNCDNYIQTHVYKTRLDKRNSNSKKSLKMCQKVMQSSPSFTTSFPPTGWQCLQSYSQKETKS
jgi:hypothetical protein